MLSKLSLPPPSEEEILPSSSNCTLDVELSVYFLEF